MATVRYAFRESFKASCKETLQWYPGHMDKSFGLMQSKIKQVDCVLEVHDARIPYSGRNPNFVKRLIGPKPHILVLNKKDLVLPAATAAISKKLKNETENVIFTNCKDQHCRGLKQVVPRAVELIQKSDRFHRVEEQKLRVMVIGVPNVGKSSLINGLRSRILHKGKATPVGALAGVTRAVQTEIKINVNPPLYLVDTPGILPPRIADSITGLKLALCSCLNDEVVGVKQIADYLLYWCNRNQYFSYVDVFGLEEPCDDITRVLMKIAIKKNKTRPFRDITSNTSRIIPDLQQAANLFIRSFREGQLGLVSLDFPKL